MKSVHLFLVIAAVLMASMPTAAQSRFAAAARPQVAIELARTELDMMCRAQCLNNCRMWHTRNHNPHICESNCYWNCLKKVRPRRNR